MIFWLTPGGDTERGLDQEGHKHLCPIKHVDPSAAAAPEGAAEKKQLSQDQRNIMEIHREENAFLKTLVFISSPLENCLQMVEIPCWYSFNYRASCKECVMEAKCTSKHRNVYNLLKTLCPLQ